MPRKFALKVLKACILAKAGIRTPLKVNHYVSYKCNFKCDYCYVKECKIGKEISTEEIKELMIKFKKMGTLVWTFIGGEPLLKQDIGKLISHAKKIGLKTQLSTNGYFIKSKIDEIKDIETIFISLEGSKEIHDEISFKGSYEKVIEAIDALRTINKEVVINTVLSKKNFDQIDFLINLVEKHNCKINFTPVYSVVEDAKKYQLNTEELKLVYKKIKNLKKTNKKISLSEDAFKRTILYSENKIKKYQKRCLAGILYCAVTPDGKVAPCYEKLKDKLKENGTYKDKLYSIKDPINCDCNINCFYNLNELFGLKPKMILESSKNLLKNRRIY